MGAAKTLRILGQATVSCLPDTIGIAFTISFLAPEYGAAFEGLNGAVAVVRKNLARIGVPKQTLKTDDFSVNPQWSRVKNESVFDGYLAKHDMHLDLPHLSDKTRERINAALVAIAASTGISNLRLSYKVSDVEGQIDRALKAAVEMGRHRASLLATASGVRLGPVLQIQYGQDQIEIRHTVRSIHDYSVAERVEVPDIEPGELQFQETVALIYQIDGPSG